MKRICIDLDGVIAELKSAGQEYTEVAVIEGALEKLKQLKDNGFYIIINTARHMKTCESNLGKLNARITKDTLMWLDENKIPYDEVYFGKPWAQIYIDDNAFRFNSWQEIEGDGSNFPRYSEDVDIERKKLEL